MALARNNNPAARSQPAMKSLSAALRKEPKKTAVLGLLAAVMLALGVRAIVRGGPAAAAASPRATADSIAPGATAMNRPADNARADRVGTALTDWLARPQPLPARNPFVVPYDAFPADGDKTGDLSDTNSPKSPSGTADQIKQRQELLDDLRTRAQKLKLQSTVMSAHPKACINGQLVGQGDVVDSFHVLKITPRRVIVEQQGVELALTMD